MTNFLVLPNAGPIFVWLHLPEPSFNTFIFKHSPHFPFLSEGNYLLVDGLNVIRVTRGPEKDIQNINHFNTASLNKTGQNFLFLFFML